PISAGRAFRISNPLWDRCWTSPPVGRVFLDRCCPGKAGSPAWDATFGEIVPRPPPQGGKVEQKEHVGGVKRFGSYLRGVREGRKLSLDAVEELSTVYPERITKSHLSRIENGQALPTFPRLFALGQIYGVPVASLAERFEVHYQLEQLPKIEEAALDRAGLQARLDRLRDEGRYAEALDLILAAIERAGEDVAVRTDLRVGEVQCLVHLGRFELAKAQCEE